MGTLAYLVFTGYGAWKWGLAALLALLCLVRWDRAVARLSAPINRRPWLGIVLVGIVSFLSVSLLAARRGVPLPYVHDEFSYMLAADTFARGRLTNPAPPLAEHFETMHVLVRPTYQSKYPPGQGLSMAAGQLIAGHPIWGIWGVTALACAALAWMLLGIVPPRWAMAGGLLAAVHPQILEWGQRYWGGNLAVLGGALFAGGLLRVMAGRRGAAWMASGMVILANSRPYEGLVLVLLGLGWLGWHWRFVKADVALPSTRRISGSVALPMLLVLIPAGLWMGYYNWRVTGNPLRLPYQEHHSQYGHVPLFKFQALSPKPSYTSPELENFYVRDQNYYFVRRNSWSALAREAIENVHGLALTLAGNVPSLWVPLLLIPALALKDRRVRALIAILAAFVCALLIETYCYGHYAAPAAGVAAALVILGLRRLHRGAETSPILLAVGPYLARLAVALFVLLSAFWWQGFYNWKQEGFPAQRRQVLTGLNSRPGRHLVIVRYAPDHNVHDEWVYNEADIESARVVWARELNAAAVGRLIERFPDRSVWLLEPDAHPTQLRPVDGAGAWPVLPLQD